jgi:hypothetical protein
LLNELRTLVAPGAAPEEKLERIAEETCLAIGRDEAGAHVTAWPFYAWRGNRRSS